MPLPVLSSPGVYIEELPSSVHPIVGVATSITAFIGRALRGPTDTPTLIGSFADFSRIYGGLWIDATLGYAVQQFFLNGGTQALIVRATDGTARSHLLLGTGATMELVAANDGAWGDKLAARVDHDTNNTANANLFNLFVKDTATGVLETFRNVSIDPSDPRYVVQVLEQGSDLVRVAPLSPIVVPQITPTGPAGSDPYSAAGKAYLVSTPGGDGNAIKDADITGAGVGLALLDKADLFNILCLPPPARDKDWLQTTWDAAITYAQGRRAFVIVDSPHDWAKASDALSKIGTVVTHSNSAAIYYPRVLLADPLKENRLDTFAPCGIIAGIYARTDAQRGVWKAPAGIEATLSGVSGLSLNGQPGLVTDFDNGQLNPKGINCLRSFPVAGNVLWGARTLDGSDQLASQWKYVPVRRLAYFIEESLYRSTQWVVFEPNDAPLWSQIRFDITAFMQSLFLQGAFQGATPSEAFFVQCDSTTTTQADIDNGIVNIIVGFAPLKPAEFVVIQIQQIASQ